MEHTITQQVSIHPLNARLWKCEKSDAIYQLETYHSDKSPEKNIGVISKYNGNFSYSSGATVDVKSRVNIAFGCWLTNVIINENLLKHIREHY